MGEAIYATPSEEAPADSTDGEDVVDAEVVEDEDDKK
jgi:hypothetical protein